jgi:hypothetical protein
MLNKYVDLTPDEQRVVLYPGSEAETCEALTRWLKEDAPSAVDITFGTGEMTAILLTAARRSGARVRYLRHDYLDKSNAPKFGTEQYVKLDWTLS